MDAELSRLLSEADRALGRLEGASTLLPNPDLFVAMYVKHEAVLSSQIEGTQSTLEDVLAYEVEGKELSQPGDLEETFNYVRAMNHGIRRLPELPLSLRLIREVHGQLLAGVRGGERNPGEFRTTQNWIGGSGRNLNEAVFVPPPPHEMNEALGAFERFLHDTQSLPVLVHAGLAHAQFETIHPFLDGNGRVGRLLITLLLCERKVLEQPLLYLSFYLKAHRAQYYDRLMAVRTDGDWEGWLRFFLRGVAEVSRSAAETARAILRMREEQRQRLAGSPNALRLLDHLFQQPIVTVRRAEEVLDVSFATAAGVIEQLEAAKVLRKTTDQKRNRKFRFDPYLALFDQQVAAIRPEVAP